MGAAPKLYAASAQGAGTFLGEDVDGNYHKYDAIQFELDVTSAANAANDTLDVTIQAKLDGTNYVDVVHFTQILGNGGAKRIIAKIVRDLAQAQYDGLTAPAAGAERHTYCDVLRVKAVVVSGTAAAFTYTVLAIPLPRR